MALSTHTIMDSVNWAKRMSFNRNPIIGNSLEPALTSANMVLQTILGPPFTWWWNAEELVFTCNPTANTATITNVAITAKVLTITAANTFAVGNLVTLSGVTTAAFLNGVILNITSASPTQFTAFFNHADYASAADIGTVINVTTQDYTIATPEFSHIEHASVLDLDATNKPVKWYELTVRDVLSLDSSTGRPEFIGPHVEDGNGNVTFRVMSSPDKPYPISIHVQLAAPQVTSINQSWSPLPDYMQYVYNWGFLALIWQFSDDPRGMYASDRFVSALLSRTEGLTEQERNIFLANWNNMMTEGVSNMKNQQGVAARGK